jgi:hypothetical protein
MALMDKETSRMMIEIQLENICKIVNGTWHRQSLLNSKGELSERIIITYPSPDASGDNNNNS